MKPLARIPRRCFSTSAICKYAAPVATETSSSSSMPTFKPYPFSTKVTPQDVPAELIPNDNRFINKKRLKHDFQSPPLNDLRKGVGLIPYIHRTLPRPQAHEMLSSYFAKKGKGRITPGTVLTVTLSKPPYTFSGVLIAIRRKGPDSSILLRNVVRKIGVEMRIFLASPTLLGIKVIQRAGGTKMNELSMAQKTGKNGKAGAKKMKHSEAAKLLDTESAKGWKLGTPGAVPTMRVARAVGIIKDRRRRRAVAKDAVKVDERDAQIGKRMVRAKLYFLRDYPGRMSAISAGITKKD